MELPKNWQTTAGGLLQAAGQALQLAGQPAIGMILTGVGAFLLGNAAADKKVTKEAVREVRQEVAENSTHIQEVKERTRVMMAQPLMPPPSSMRR